MALLERAQALEAAGHDILHLAGGEPDFPCAAPVMDAARRCPRCAKPLPWTTVIGSAPR